MESEKAAKRAWCDWLVAMGPWDWFVTRTFANAEYGFTRPGVRTTERCVRDLLEIASARKSFAVLEWQKRGWPHIHALLTGSPFLDGKELQERDYKKYGIARWIRLKDDRAVAKYVVKYVLKEHGITWLNGRRL